MKEVLDDWYKRVVGTQNAHYLSADHFAARSRWLGVPVILLSTFVGTSVFATLKDNPGTAFQIAVGICSVAAAVLSSLQTFLGYAERAEKHRVAGAKYGAVGRELEMLRAAPDGYSKETVDDVRKRLETLALKSPNNPLKIYDRAIKSLGYSN